MSRLTITLSQERYRALKETSAQRNKTIGQLIEESLDFYGIKSRDSARELVRRARDRTGPDGKEASGWMRMSACFRRQQGTWQVVHEHFSAPSDPLRDKALWLPELSKAGR